MVESYLKSIGFLLGKEFRPVEIYSLYAEPNTGKTLYLMGEIINAIKNGYRVLWIDTEGGFDGLWERWFPVLDSRLEGKFVKENLSYVRLNSYEDAMMFLGRKISLKYGKEKTELLYIKDLDTKELNPIYNSFSKKRGNTMIVMDSLTNLMRMSIPTSMQNFPVRADATAILINSINLLADRTDAPIIITNHASKNPADIYHGMSRIRGGSTLVYNSKYIVYMQKPMKKVLEDYRKIWAVRSPLFKEWGESRWVKITGNGFEDVTAEEIDAVINNADNK